MVYIQIDENTQHYVWHRSSCLMKLLDSERFKICRKYRRHGCGNTRHVPQTVESLYLTNVTKCLYTYTYHLLKYKALNLQLLSVANSNVFHDYKSQESEICSWFRATPPPHEISPVLAIHLHSTAIYSVPIWQSLHWF